MRHFPPDEKVAVLTVARYLQLSFSTINGKILYASGYSPDDEWLKTEKVPQFQAVPGQLFVQDTSDNDMTASVGYDTSLSGAQIYYHEPSSQLVIGDVDTTDIFIEIATDIFIGLRGNELNCVIVPSFND